MSDAYWEIFKNYFRGKKEIIRNKLEEISTVRNSLAHFRPIKYDDIELIKQNIKHTFVGIEDCFEHMLSTNRVVPTNTDHDWYKDTMKRGSKRCAVALFQDSSENWIRMHVSYHCATLRESRFSDDYRSYVITKLMTPAIIGAFGGLGRNCVLLSESVSHRRGDEPDRFEFIKSISLTFSKKCIEDEYTEICESLEDFLLKVENETELVETDNLARGDLIDSARVRAAVRRAEGDQKWWSVDKDELACKFGENDPPEYWGSMGQFSVNDFIANTKRYPWMPSDISKEDEIPF